MADRKSTDAEADRLVDRRDTFATKADQVTVLQLALVATRADRSVARKQLSERTEELLHTKRALTERCDELAEVREAFRTAQIELSELRDVSSFNGTELEATREVLTQTQEELDAASHEACRSRATIQANLDTFNEFEAAILASQTELHMATIRIEQLEAILSKKDARPLPPHPPADFAGDATMSGSDADPGAPREPITETLEVDPAEIDVDAAEGTPVVDDLATVLAKIANLAVKDDD